MPMMGRATRLKSIIPTIVTLVGGRMLRSAAHTGFESISGTRDKHTGGSKRVPTLVLHLSQDQPSLGINNFSNGTNHPIKLFTGI